MSAFGQLVGSYHCKLKDGVCNTEGFFLKRQRLLAPQNNLIFCSKYLVIYGLVEVP